MKTYEEMEADDVREFPYMVYHPDGYGEHPKFRTWAEALARQKEWNQDCPGHKAKRRLTPAKETE